jgi:hypothetical protein
MSVARIKSLVPTSLLRFIVLAAGMIIVLWLLNHTHLLAGMEQLLPV